MTEMITAPQVLEFLLKAQQLNMRPNIKQVDNGYVIELYYNWHGGNDHYINTTFISSQSTSNWEDGDVVFDHMNDYMDKELDILKAEEIKEQKRKKLISRLTVEEKELLGLK